MHLLYADESGLVEDMSQRHFVLAGVCVFESATQNIASNLDAIITCFAPHMPELELHGSPIRSGKGFFRKIALADREQLIKDALIAGVIAQPAAGVRLFGCVVEKIALCGYDPVRYCFEQIATRFNLFLQHRAVRYHDPQHGLILFDESTMEHRLRRLAREFEMSGQVYGAAHHYAEVPVFLDSRASRLVQLADLVAYSLFRHFEHSDSQYFDLLKNRFDQDAETQHGFVLVRTP